MDSLPGEKSVRSNSTPPPPTLAKTVSNGLGNSTSSTSGGVVAAPAPCSLSSHSSGGLADPLLSLSTLAQLQQARQQLSAINGLSRLGVSAPTPATTAQNLDDAIALAALSSRTTCPLQTLDLLKAQQDHRQKQISAKSSLLMVAQQERLRALTGLLPRPVSPALNSRNPTGC